MAKENKALEVAKARIDENYILTQVNYHYDSEAFRDHKNRMEDGDKLYRGDLEGLFPDDSAVPKIPYVENKFKNALHDLSRLATEGRATVKFYSEGEKAIDAKRANIRESINEGYWRFNRMAARERLLYLDLVGAGFMALGLYADYDAEKGTGSMYPKIDRFNPRFGYPDVRNGKLQSYLNVEVQYERILARQFPRLGLDDNPSNPATAYLACYYDDMDVYEAVILHDSTGVAKEALKTKHWPHELGCVPVAFEMLDTYDGSFHGLFEQLKGPLLARNKIMRFLVDSIESIAHAPKIAEGVLNADDPEGPDVVYQLDPNAERTQLTRLQPAAPAGALFGLLQYAEDQEQKESIQPPSRSGNVSQSIASGSFVDRTQGQLTSVVKELQDKMSSVREQVNECGMKMEEKFLDFSKPLVRPIGGKKMYTPSEDIKGWYFHEVTFGAGAGLDRINTDQRVQGHLAARLVSRETAQEQVEYLDSVTGEMDKITRENLQDVIFQRMAQDPATPMSALGAVWLEMARDGATFEEALRIHMPNILAAEAAARPQPGIPVPPGQAPAEVGPGEQGPTTAEQELGALQAQAPDLAAVTQRPPLSLIQQRP